MLEFQNVSKSFLDDSGKKIDVLKEVSFSVPQGSIFGIIGKSGAGKTTLLRCCSLLEQPDTGSIHIDGQQIFDLSPKKLQSFRQNISCVFQGYNLLQSRNVFDNIALPLRLAKYAPAFIHKRVSHLLEQVDIPEKAKAYPSQLSGGQKQRVAIARALANHPKVLLLDEPTSALDPQIKQKILKLIRRLQQETQVTMLMISHSMQDISSICDRAALLEEGSVTVSSGIEHFFKHSLKVKSFLKEDPAFQNGTLG